MIILVHLVVSLGMLVIVPLGLTLMDVPARPALGPSSRPAPRWWFAFAVPGAVSLWLPRGALSITLASIYLAGTLALVVLAAVDLVRRKRLRAREIALYTALVTPSIAALSLVAERSSYELFGFNLTVLSLTVAHFHFAGFAAALIAFLVAGTSTATSTAPRTGTGALADSSSAAARTGTGALADSSSAAARTGTGALADSSSRAASAASAASAAAISVPLGTGIVLLGFFLGDSVELAGAAVLTAGMWLVGWHLWRRSRETDRTTATLLVVSASVLVVTMLLALSWALGHVVATPYLPLEWMVATHGLANAVGFGLCGLLARRRLQAAEGVR
ncbi:hypothetical protein GCM10009744_58310 [Kribbella alba]|uniref:YndJ-like protein n=1 Tax=Kribbella alba TaxID=190197 RepID=A0ABP4RMC0_9ACTN